MTETSTSPRQRVRDAVQAAKRRPMLLGVGGLLIGALASALITYSATAPQSPPPQRPHPTVALPALGPGYGVGIGHSASEIASREEAKQRYREIVAEERFEEWVQEELTRLRPRCTEISWTRTGVPYCAGEMREVGIRPKDSASDGGTPCYRITGRDDWPVPCEEG